MSSASPLQIFLWVGLPYLALGVFVGIKAALIFAVARSRAAQRGCEGGWPWPSW